jgi:aldehyde dehydrogenase
MSNSTEQAVKQLELKNAYGNFINGQFAPSQTGETFTNLTPITGKPLCEVQRSRAADGERALVVSGARALHFA